MISQAETVYSVRSVRRAYADGSAAGQRTRALAELDRLRDQHAAALDRLAAMEILGCGVEDMTVAHDLLQLAAFQLAEQVRQCHINGWYAIGWNRTDNNPTCIVSEMLDAEWDDWNAMIETDYLDLLERNSDVLDGDNDTEVF